MCYVESNKKCDFVDILEFSSTFSSIHFWARKFWINFRKLFLLSIFIFCHVNWTRVPRRIEQKAWFCRSFWIFFYVLELNSFSASQIFTKLQEILNSINNCILPCKLDLCAMWSPTNSVILSIFLNFSLRSGS